MAVVLRRALPRDAAALSGIYAPFVEHGLTSFEVVVPDAEAFELRVQKVDDQGLPWLVAERAGTVVGYAYAGLHRERYAYSWSVESSVYLASDAAGGGLGTRLMRALLALLELQGYRSVLAGLTLPNDASLALHRMLGFEEVGVYRDVGFKHGTWASVWWGQRLLASSCAPRLPIRIADLDRAVVGSILERE